MGRRSTNGHPSATGRKCIWGVVLLAGLALFGRSAMSAQSVTTAPPDRSHGEPSGTLAAGTTRTGMSLLTKQNARCRYATTAGTAYTAMTETFTTTGGMQHATALNGLANGKSYTYYVRCQATGGAANSDDFRITFSVAAAPAPTPNPKPNPTPDPKPNPTPSDTASPTITITAPLNGAKVEGRVTIRASATDKAGVTSVTFLVDGTALGSDTTSPYSISWDTSDLKPGSHTIRAQARDAKGNVGTSRDVTVTVSDDRPPQLSGRVIFAPSSPDTGVTRYVLRIFRDEDDDAGDGDDDDARDEDDDDARDEDDDDALDAGDDDLVATQNLGKPPVMNGEISADISRTLASLRNGTYFATVTAVASGQSAGSEPSEPFVVRSGRLLSAVTLSAVSEMIEPPPNLPRWPSDERPVETTDTARLNGTLWVTDPSTSLATALDATTGDVLATVPVGLRPMGGVAPADLNKVYVADEGSDTVSVISKATMAVVTTIQLPPPSGRQPHHVSASPDGRFVYVGERGSNVVDVIDTATDLVSARFAAGSPGSKTLAVVPDPAGELLYAVNRGVSPSPSTLTALEASSGNVRWQMPIDDPRHFLIGPDGRTGLLSHDGRGTITVIDLEGRTVINEINLGASAEIDTLQLSSNGRYLLARLRAANAGLSIVDLMETSVRTVSLRPVASSMTSSATEPMYFPVSDSSELPAGVLVVDAAAQRVVRQFTLPGRGTPHAAVFDGAR